MKHLDLFSGIGGFALAGQMVWGDEYECIGFCDIEQYCQKLLNLRFPGVPIYGDIRTIKNDQATECDIVTGGFPCQPFSHAGKRRGTADDRWLWGEMLRVIKSFQPQWVIAENVRGLVTISSGLVFQQVCVDLEAAGYQAQAFIIPACAKNAPHRRDRVWIVANRTSKRSDNGKHHWEKRHIQDDQGFSKENQPKRTGWQCEVEPLGAVDSNPASIRLEGDKPQKNTGQGGFICGNGGGKNASWGKNWVEVATEFCGVDDGVPAKLDGFELSKQGHYQARLKGLGNAIVPQVAAEIMQAIKFSMEGAK
jgi:DNA (cytosine-5)-methyltransferase 1